MSRNLQAGNQAMSNKPARNAVLRALELGSGGKSLDDIQRRLKRSRPVNLGTEEGQYVHCDNLSDEEVIAILRHHEASGDAYCRRGFWYRDGGLE
jgi:hypothetical protein